LDCHWMYQEGGGEGRKTEYLRRDAEKGEDLE
jgi:hypothetical protein